MIARQQIIKKKRTIQLGKDLKAKRTEIQNIEKISEGFGNAESALSGGDGFTGSLMRQRLDEDEMLNELYTLGKKGNMLVLKKSLFGTSVFYSGPSENFPLTERTSLHFGKKKWDGGQLVYLEQK